MKSLKKVFRKPIKKEEETLQADYKPDTSMTGAIREILYFGGSR
jgi:hypothetical protein